MKFRTEYKPHPCSKFTLSPLNKVILLGSCFSINVGAKMEKCLWPSLVNPLGTLYNPASIANAIKLGLCYNHPHIDYYPPAKLWYSYDFSTLFSRSSKEEVEAITTSAIGKLEHALTEATALIITFGTSLVYSKDGKIVANCHKHPASTFHRSRLSVNEIVDMWTPLISQLRKKNPELKCIFTVSPIRHLSDGFEQNALSKATLLLACEALSKLPGCDYFPAFEILTDDLRDYRFYADDLLHPSAFAIDYIFEAFLSTYLTTTDIELLRKNEKEYKRNHHRQIHL